MISPSASIAPAQNWAVPPNGRNAPRDTAPVVLISHRVEEPATDEVLEWLLHLGVPVMRLNGEDFATDLPFRIELRSGAETEAPGVEVEVDGVSLAKTPAFWLRRWHSRTTLEYLRSGAGEVQLRGRLYEFLHGEITALREGVRLSMPDAFRITDTDQLFVNKLRMLSLAGRCGLCVPPTLVTNSRAELLEFMARHGELITKPIGEALVIPSDEGMYGLFTEIVTPARAAELPERFFPSLFQPRLDKTFEVRVFVLGDELWGMATFSQDDASTRVDFRRVAGSSFNRQVPYAVPEREREPILAFMAAAGLTTGSIDMIRSPDGTLWFLEVNPVGQFSMVSHPCNYHLEKRIAERLARESGYDV
jgi:hypothetical protein